MRKFTTSTLAAVFAIGTMLFGAASSAQYDDELLIGDFQPLSGTAAAGGLGNHRGLVLAIKHYNEGSHPLNPTPGLTVGGKTYKLTTVVYDHKYTTEGGVTAANKLVFDDGAKFVLGTWGSAPSISASETVFEPNKILFATTGWSQKCIGPDKPFTFRLHMTGLQYNGAFYDYASVHMPDKKRMAILAANDESGFAVAKDLEQIADRLGLEVVAKEFHDRGATDMYPFLTRILAAEPDILDTGGGVPGEEAQIMKQLHELGGGVLVSGAGQVPGVLLDIAGKEAVEGAYLAQTINYDTEGDIITDLQRKFAADYKATFNEPEAPFQGREGLRHGGRVLRGDEEGGQPRHDEGPRYVAGAELDAVLGRHVGLGRQGDLRHQPPAPHHRLRQPVPGRQGRHDREGAAGSTLILQFPSETMNAPRAMRAARSCCSPQHVHLPSADPFRGPCAD